MDTSISACEDFYSYAGGGWLKNHPIPSDQSAWGRFEELEERNRNIILDLLKQTAANPRSPIEKTVGAYFQSCMDETRIEQLDLKPLFTLMKDVDAIRNQEDLQREIARLHTINIHVAFQSDSKQDAKNSSDVILEIWQAGIGLPEGEYYSKEDHQKIREAYQAHIEKMFEFTGESAEASRRDARVAFDFETALARNWMHRSDRRVPKNVYNRMTLVWIQKMYPNINWSAYESNIGVAHKTDINVGQIPFFENLNHLFTDVTLDDWKTYLRWRILDSIAPTLPKRFVDEDFSFHGRVMTGAVEMESRWKRCVDDTEEKLGQLVGQLFVRDHFKPDTKERAIKMVDALRASLAKRISSLEWMDDATKAEAEKKLQAIQNKIGYPSRWIDYSSLRLSTSSYLANWLKAEQFENDRDQKKIGHPVDTEEWALPPQTVDAGYVASMNEVLFPAGILQPPLFDPASSDAFNFGGMGAAIGHEFTHGFDDEGRQYDASGNLRDWWSADDASAFQSRADCVSDQFSSYSVEPGLSLNGKLVLGESIADLGGLRIAFAAFHDTHSEAKTSSSSQFTPDQLFFLGWAQMWIESQRPEDLRLQVTTNPHPPAKFRVNGPLSNMPEFAAAFGCKPGDPMVRAADLVCKVW